MSKTVVGIFEYESDAQNAQNYLLANGFGDGDVDLKTARYKEASDDSAPADTDENVLERIGTFFKELFQGHEDETERYTEAGKQGTIVTVHATTADEAIAAAHIMDNYGAVDVMNRSAVHRPGEQYEDPIVNPPGVAETPAEAVDSVEARGLYQRSRVIDRAVEPHYRLRHQKPQTDRISEAEPGDATELNRTVSERDALINQIVDHDQSTD